MLAGLLVGDRAQPEPLRVARGDREDVVEQRDRLAREIPSALHRDRLGQLSERRNVLPVELDGAAQRFLRPPELVDAEVAPAEKPPALDVVGLAREPLLEARQELADRRCARGLAAVRPGTGTGPPPPGRSPRRDRHRCRASPLRGRPDAGTARRRPAARTRPRWRRPAARRRAPRDRAARRARRRGRVRAARSRERATRRRARRPRARRRARRAARGRGRCWSPGGPTRARARPARGAGRRAGARARRSPAARPAGRRGSCGGRDSGVEPIIRWGARADPPRFTVGGHPCGRASRSRRPSVDERRAAAPRARALRL